MSEEPGAFLKPRLLSIRKHLEARGDKEPFTTLAQFLSYIHESSARWQQDDWKRREDDERDVLNPVRIVGQLWSVVRETRGMASSPASTAKVHGGIC
jgi:hypothetical protein